MTLLQLMPRMRKPFPDFSPGLWQMLLQHRPSTVLNTALRAFELCRSTSVPV
jgi:hypothetical protein